MKIRTMLLIEQRVYINFQEAFGLSLLRSIGARELVALRRESLGTVPGEGRSHSIDSHLANTVSNRQIRVFW